MSAFRTTTRLVSRRPAAIAQSLRFAPRWMSQDAQNKLLAANLQKSDPAVYDIVQKVRMRRTSSQWRIWLTIEQEKRRQKHFINLIPSENFTSQAVLDALGSVMQSMFAVEGCFVEAATDSCEKTSTRRDIQEPDTTAVTNTLTRPSGYVKSEL